VRDYLPNAEQKRFRLLRDLSSYDFTSALNRTRNKRHLGTAEWVFKTPEFQEWAKSNQSSVLHLTGKSKLHNLTNRGLTCILN
jgi:hypothetical protein